MSVPVGTSTVVPAGSRVTRWVATRNSARRDGVGSTAGDPRASSPVAESRCENAEGSGQGGGPRSPALSSPPPPPPPFGLNIVGRTQSRGRGKGAACPDALVGVRPGCSYRGGVTRINGPFGTRTQAEPGPSLDQGGVLKIEAGNKFLSCKHR